MALLRDVFLKKPPRANFDRSMRHNFTMAPGVGYVSYVDEVLPGDSWAIRTIQDVRTYPLLAPLLGSFTLQNAWFFIPSRLYVQSMDQNRRTFFKGEAAFPWFVAPTGAIASDPASVQTRVKKSSLLEKIGLPAGFYRASTASNPVSTAVRLNAIPLIGYYDIFRNYYANGQEEYFPLFAPIKGTSTPNPVPSIVRVKLDGIDTLIQDIVKDEAATSFSDLWTGAFAGDLPTNTPSDPVMASRLQPLGGCWVKTHKSDMFTSWLSKGVYDDMVSSSNIVVENGTISINQIRFGNHLINYYERGLLGNGRYDDWVEAQYGVRCSRDLCIPQLLGASVTPIVFDEVVATASTGEAINGSVGDLGGKGYGQGADRPIRFSADEHGYVMCITTITPNVQYSQQTLPYLSKLNNSQTFAPALDRIGFQSLPVQYLWTSPSVSNESPKWNSESIGYQPAWTEYTTAVNRSTGDLAVGGDLEYWNIVRDFTNPQFDVPGRVEAFDATSYIRPDQYSYAFANQSPIAENFIVQMHFDVWCRRTKGKSIMPKLS